MGIASGNGGFSIMARELLRASDYVTCRHCRRDFRAITFRHLRNIHDYDDDHPIQEYKRKFRLRVALCDDSRTKISEAKVNFWAKRGQHWTQKTLIAEIRRLHRTGKSLNCKRVPVRLYEAGRRLLGSWEKAVLKAGLDYARVTSIRRWSPAKVVVAIRELAARGLPLYATYVEQHFAYLYKAAITQFPRSWAKALRAAGFDPNLHRMPRGRWDKEKAVAWLQQRVAKRRSLLAGDAPPDLLNFVRKRLATSWTDFVESLGIPYPGIKKRRDWTRSKVLSEMRQWAKSGPMNYRAVQLANQPLLRQAKKFFGSWDLARAAARV